MFTVCLQKTCLQTVLSLNSHRKMKTAPSFENIPHLYEKIGVLAPHFEGFRHYIYDLFTEIDLARGNYDMDTFKTSKWGLASCLKNIPHLIGQKMGKMHPSIRIVYFLFTKIDRANKKCAFQRIKIGSGAFHPDQTFRMGLWGPPYKFSSSPKDRRKASAISCTPSRKP